MDGVKEDIMELKSAVNTEMMVLKAEVAKSGPTVSLPECPICMQDMAPPTRIIQCQMGHKVCEPCHDAAMGRGRRDCPGHSLRHQLHWKGPGHGGFPEAAHWE